MANEIQGPTICYAHSPGEEVVGQLTRTVDEEHFNEVGALLAASGIGVKLIPDEIWSHGPETTIEEVVEIMRGCSLVVLDSTAHSPMTDALALMAHKSRVWTVVISHESGNRGVLLWLTGNHNRPDGPRFTTFSTYSTPQQAAGAIAMALELGW